MNLHTALPIAVGAGVVLTGVLAWLTYRPEKPARRIEPVPAPDTQGLIQAYGWPEITIDRPIHPTHPLLLEALTVPPAIDFDVLDLGLEDADGE